ncbi:hypothetical protein BJ170DRAFT_413502 [Xylariales sp. AK1849]|nr:hypothetical protein BJ170DRAFT_413502 [Xylariales sp. AK1849]
MMDVQVGPSFSRSAAAGRSQGNPLAANGPSNYNNATGMRKMRKRKADSQDNERLSKRLSLLNLEQNGNKLYVPVESPQLRPITATSLRHIPSSDSMQLDDPKQDSSKHKVYIYDLDAELSDSGESDDGKLVFLPDIEKHILQNRIPPSVLANKDGELAGMQMVLYSEPTSLTVPEEQDSVRKAILEARARVRRKQSGDSGEDTQASSVTMKTPSENPGRVPNGLNNLANHVSLQAATMKDSTWSASDEDPDAMELD